MFLSQYIQEVLFKQHICVVPGLGTFTMQHFPSRFDAGANSLTAPYEEALFSPSWDDDGSCVEWIALKENLVPAIAQRKLEKYLAELKTSLQSGTPLNIPGIGQLESDAAGNLHFHPEQLPTEKTAIHITPARRPDNNNVVPPTPTVATASVAATPEPPLPATSLEPMMTEEMEETLDAVTTESGFKWWWAAIPIAMIVIGLAAWWYISSVPAAVTAANSLGSDTATARQMAAAADSLKKVMADSAAKAAVTELSYFAVIESYTDSTRAAKKQKQQAAWGRSLVVYKRDQIYRIALELHSLPADTTRQLDSIRNIYGNKVFLEFK
ncbi:hypothetical protein [Chitinophaga sp. 212800010-3]|uniref:HU domain-containing protein n=1 Tax=unclassified Chitinophaga TaxID=2619133 RepID=UPI002DE43550|nr:HU-CCDC81-bac-1 domain-containing protein [Chitinophaga sp. 212800010-3]